MAAMGKRSRRKRFGPTGFEEFGGYMNAKIQKLENQFLNSAQNEIDSSREDQSSPIFKGISVFVNGYTNPTAEEIRRIMMLHGGTYQHYYKRKPNCYMIATNLPPAKLIDLRDYVVKPNWISDSVHAGKLLPVQDYLLYTPDLKNGQQKLSVVRCEKPSTSAASPQNSTSQNNDQDSWLSSENSHDEDEHTECHAENSVHQESKKDSIEPRKAGDPGFLEQFYGRSRLHHISTASIKLRDYVAQKRAVSSGAFDGIEELKCYLASKSSREQVPVGEDKVIMHIDMDCFFVSVGLRTRPHLKGKPVAVCHGKTSLASMSCATLNSQTERSDLVSCSEVASCSYEARKAGVKSRMYLGQARKLCPGLVAIPYEFESYDEVSRLLYDVVASFTLDIEAISCDEMFADVTNVLQQASCSPNEFAEFLRKKINEKTLCTASVGLGPNMLAARVANRFAKPNGHHFVDSSSLLTFFENVNVKDLPGVGYRLQAQLSEMGVETCKQLQALPLETLKAKFGVKTSSLLYNYARGIDNRGLQFDKMRKSVSAEVNYGIRFKEPTDMIKFIGQLSTEVERRLMEAGVQGRTITLKVKVRQKDAPLNPAKYMGHGLCDNLAKSSHLLSATASKAIISKECYSLAMQMHLVASDIRGVGIQVGRLEPLPSGQGGGVKTMLDFLTTSRPPENHEAAGPSSGQAGTTNGTAESLPKAVSLPAFSEIDPAVLDSLPPDIKDEVLTMYRESRRNPLRSKETAASTSGVSSTKSSNHSHRGAPSSAASTKTKAQPTGRRRGRPPKGSISPQKARLLACHSLKEYMTKPVQTAVETFESVIDSEKKMEQVKALLQQWINTTNDAALNSDVIAWTNVLCSIVHERNLEMLDVLLKFFHRTVQKNGAQLWQDTYMKVVNTVQGEVLQVFGHFMKVPIF
ncbi:rev1 DNA directed polymerase [Dermacentor variabilis]|uniref:rev1 DNA directed polymerase n=1 Tax=Dermacentor variabilis TaxID=34621 RepID=UPI003F5BE5CB